jgi:hypothetical protein
VRYHLKHGLFPGEFAPKINISLVVPHHNGVELAGERSHRKTKMGFVFPKMHVIRRTKCLFDMKPDQLSIRTHYATTRPKWRDLCFARPEVLILLDA